MYCPFLFNAATATPPLSAGSGYSSHSHSPSPVSPYSQGPSVLGMPPTKGSPPSPSGILGSANTGPITEKAAGTPASPLSSIRLPFFDKYRNKLPGLNTNTPTTDTTLSNTIATNGNGNTPAAASAEDADASQPVSDTKIPTGKAAEDTDKRSSTVNKP